MPAPPAMDWYALFTSLPKKEDFQSLLEEVKTMLRTEISALGTSLTALEARVQTLESQSPDLHCPAVTTTKAQVKQIQDLRLHVEDLDKRSRRHNIREAQIRYRWQFPFALTARRGNTEATIRIPRDIQAFQEALDLLQTPILDWTNCPVNERSAGSPVHRNIQQGPDTDYTPLQQAEPEE
ncbi:Hypothetical predicted protein [Pelobates cultripes]|uniref:Uncharacterized protein n=1 Tax=Pelobates cultripes TaxID=61616 RepID=A0AAD1RU83_PELCU|nr:Hypothetical predicted protein [Pelobates cultripes]